MTRGKGEQITSARRLQQRQSLPLPVQAVVHTANQVKPHRRPEFLALEVYDAQRKSELGQPLLDAGRCRFRTDPRALEGEGISQRTIRHARLWHRKAPITQGANCTGIRKQALPID